MTDMYSANQGGKARGANLSRWNRQSDEPQHIYTKTVFTLSNSRYDSKNTPHVSGSTVYTAMKVVTNEHCGVWRILILQQKFRHESFDGKGFCIISSINSYSFH